VGEIRERRKRNGKAANAGRYHQTKLLATVDWAGKAKILYAASSFFQPRRTNPRKPHPAASPSHLHSFSFSLMGNLLYIIAVILIIIWALGFFGIMGAGIAGNSLIHILLVIAIIAILLRVISGRNPV
jgi:amino acid transporter